MEGAGNGANRDRTGDLWLAKPALSQLSYGPLCPAQQQPAHLVSLPYSIANPGHRVPAGHPLMSEPVNPVPRRRVGPFCNGGGRPPTGPLRLRYTSLMNRFLAGWIVAATAGTALAGCHVDGSSDRVGANSVDSPGNPAEAGRPLTGTASPSAADIPAGNGAASSVSRSEPGNRAVGTDSESFHERPQAAAATPEAAPTSPPARFEFERPEHIRGIYVNAWSAGSRRRLAALIDIARRTEINAFVIDIKDATGFVSHPTDVPLAREVGATGEVRIPDLRWTLRQLDSAGIYPIARIVIVKDPLLARAKPYLAIQDTAGGPWRDNNGTVWLNPYQREVWDYHVDLAREVAAMGIGEIQWDYVRFPDAPASVLRRAHFPGGNGQPKRQAIREFLAYSRDALSPMGVDVTADVFGVTTSATGDVGIGQVWESFIDVVDVALPMVYPSHYWTGAFGLENPNAHPYEVVRRALEDAGRRSALVEGAGDTRPWLQDFTLGKPRYGAAEVRAQIQAAYDVGIREWVLWNPGSRYTEDALEPAVGFVGDPLVRIAGQVLPASRRFDVFDTASAEEVPDSADAPAVEKDSAAIIFPPH